MEVEGDLKQQKPMLTGPEETKVCARCMEERPVTEYQKKNGHGKYAKYLGSYCRKCLGVRAAERRLDLARTNPEEAKRRDRSANLRKNYGISQVDYDERLSRQGGLCAICRGSNTSRRRAFFDVDHCHSTGVVRGILCSKCNTGLGLFGDSRAVLANAIAYLEQYASN